MTKRKIVLIVLALISIVAVIAVMKTSEMTFNKEAKVKPVADPLDITLDFYDSWLDLAKGTTTDPYQSDLINSPLVAPTLKQRLQVAKSGNQALDPFFCQTNIPDRIGGKVLYQLEGSAEVIILNKTASSTSAFSQAIVSLEKGADSWVMTKITCSTGEVAPESEFSFEQDGYLIKSLGAPYVNGAWHLVFAVDGKMGYVAPLIFSTSTECVSINGSTVNCDPDSLIEGTTAKVTGNMLEEGAEVVKLELR